MVAAAITQAQYAPEEKLERFPSIRLDDCCWLLGGLTMRSTCWLWERFEWLQKQHEMMNLQSHAKQ